MIGGLKRVGRIVLTRSMPVRARFDLLLALARHRLSGAQLFRVRFPVGPVFLARETFEIDVKAFLDVFVREAFAATYPGAAVVDVGAHKGYFAAYAFCHGAGSVISYEPESQNYKALELAARHSSRPWVAEHRAVGAVEGELELVVSASSWAHSLFEESVAARDPVGHERVWVTTADGVLRQAAARSPDHKLVVKINAEGAECAIVLDTPADAWGSVAEVVLEKHWFAQCTTKDIVARLREAGLNVAEVGGIEGYEALRFVRGDLARSTNPPGDSGLAGMPE